MANTFYGNIANKNKTSLQFDKIVTSTASLFKENQEEVDIKVAADDGVFVGRNVLITNPEDPSVPRQNDDGTVWQKRLVNGVITYVKIAELNPIPPSFLLVSTASVTHPIFTSEVKKEDERDKKSTNWHQYIHTPITWEYEINSSPLPNGVVVSPEETTKISLLEKKDKISTVSITSTGSIPDTDGSSDRILYNTGNKLITLQLGNLYNCLDDVYNHIYPIISTTTDTTIRKTNEWIAYLPDGKTPVTIEKLKKDSDYKVEDAKSLAEIYYLLKLVLDKIQDTDILNKLSIGLELNNPVIHKKDESGNLDAMSVKHRKPNQNESKEWEEGPNITNSSAGAPRYISAIQVDDWGHITNLTSNPISAQSLNPQYVNGIHKLILGITEVPIEGGNGGNNEPDENQQPPSMDPTNDYSWNIYQTENNENVNSNNQLELKEGMYSVKEHTLFVDFNYTPPVEKYSVEETEEVLVVMPRQNETVLNEAEELFIITEEYVVDENETLIIEEASREEDNETPSDEIIVEESPSTGEDSNVVTFDSSQSVVNHVLETTGSQYEVEENTLIMK